jgi:plastocyanin
VPVKTRPTTAALAALTVVLAACGGAKPAATAAKPTHSAAAGTTTGAKPNEVTIRLLAFKPDVIEVKARTTVTWKQTDPGFHTVTSGVVKQGPVGGIGEPDGKFDSGQIGENGNFSFRFDQPGVYPYYCQIHVSTMHGEVRVS